jgi:putative addiction module killer protein
VGRDRRDFKAPHLKRCVAYPKGYNRVVLYIVQQTDTFAVWHAELRDLRARIAIARRIERISTGTLGDVKSIGGELSELRVDVGAGYRLYFTIRGNVAIILLCGGDKSTQAGDIRKARKLINEV